MDELLQGWKLLTEAKDSGRCTSEQYDERFERILEFAQRAGLRRMFMDTIAQDDNGELCFTSARQRGWHKSKRTGAWLRTNQ